MALDIDNLGTQPQVTINVSSQHYLFCWCLLLMKIHIYTCLIAFFFKVLKVTNYNDPVFFPHQNQRIPVGDTLSLVSSALVPHSESSGGGDEVDGDMVASTSHPAAVHSFDKFRSLDFQLRFQNVFKTQQTDIQSPLPAFK